MTEEKEQTEIEKLMEVQYTKKENNEFRDKYIIDKENVIIVIKNEPTGYTMIHKRLIDGNLIEINRWPLISYYFGPIHDKSIIENLNLFMVQGTKGYFDSIYNYKEGRFIVSQNTWETIETGYNNKFLDEYNGFLGKFGIKSDYEDNDVYSYDNPITGKRIIKSFCTYDSNYYAILNTDGTIRDNKLFKGDSFSEITEIIDLNRYNSLDEFKQERIDLCNEEKKKKKEEYKKLIESRNDGSISPYLDNEVQKILKLKK